MYLFIVAGSGYKLRFGQGWCQCELGTRFVTCGESETDARCELPRYTRGSLISFIVRQVSIVLGCQMTLVFLDESTIPSPHAKRRSHHQHLIGRFSPSTIRVHPSQPIPILPIDRGRQRSSHRIRTDFPTINNTQEWASVEVAGSV